MDCISRLENSNNTRLTGSLSANQEALEHIKDSLLDNKLCATFNGFPVCNGLSAYHKLLPLSAPELVSIPLLDQYWVFGFHGEKTCTFSGSGFKDVTISFVRDRGQYNNDLLRLREAVTLEHESIALINRENVNKLFAGLYKSPVSISRPLNDWLRGHGFSAAIAKSGYFPLAAVYDVAQSLSRKTFFASEYRADELLKLIKAELAGGAFNCSTFADNMRAAVAKLFADPETKDKVQAEIAAFKSALPVIEGKVMRVSTPVTDLYAGCSLQIVEPEHEELYEGQRAPFWVDLESLCAGDSKHEWHSTEVSPEVALYILMHSYMLSSVQTSVSLCYVQEEGKVVEKVLVTSAAAQFLSSLFCDSRPCYYTLKAAHDLAGDGFRRSELEYYCAYHTNYRGEKPYFVLSVLGVTEDKPEPPETAVACVVEEQESAESASETAAPVAAKVIEAAVTVREVCAKVARDSMKPFAPAVGAVSKLSAFCKGLFAALLQSLRGEQLALCGAEAFEEELCLGGAACLEREGVAKTAINDAEAYFAGPSTLATCVTSSEVVDASQNRAEGALRESTGVAPLAVATDDAGNALESSVMPEGWQDSTGGVFIPGEGLVLIQPEDECRTDYDAWRGEDWFEEALFGKQPQDAVGASWEWHEQSEESYRALVYREDTQLGGRPPFSQESPLGANSVGLEHVSSVCYNTRAGTERRAELTFMYSGHTMRRLISFTHPAEGSFGAFLVPDIELRFMPTMARLSEEDVYYGELLYTEESMERGVLVNVDSFCRAWWGLKQTQERAHPLDPKGSLSLSLMRLCYKLAQKWGCEFVPLGELRRALSLLGAGSELLQEMAKAIKVHRVSFSKPLDLLGII